MTDPIPYLAAPERTATDEFVLRSYMPGDGPAYEDAVRSSREHLSPWLAWTKKEMSSADFENLARRSRGRYLLGEDFALGVFSTDGARLLGGAGFHPRGRSIQDGIAELGMFIRASEAGHGLGSRVLIELVRWGFTAWPWRRLVWQCEAANVGSRRCAEKAGLCYEGTLRDHIVGRGQAPADVVCFAALRDEWSAP